MPISSLMDQLLAPYIDLSAPAQEGPLHAWRPFYSWERCRLGERAQEGNLQRLLPPAFRVSLQRELGVGKNLAVRHPAELESSLRTDEWHVLIELVDSFDGLDIGQQANVASVLLSLGFFELVDRLVPTPGPEAIHSGHAAANLSATAAAARLILGIEGLRPYSLDEIILVATWAPLGSMTRFDATLDLVVQCGKQLNDLDGARYWRRQAERELTRICADHGPDSFVGHLHASRFYRGCSYVPFLARDPHTVTAEMDLCESHALAIQPRNVKEHCIARENLLPMLQSRAKEARWLGDLQLARERLERACEVDPVDSVRWIELGEVLLDMGLLREAGCCYVKAAGYGPPGTALAWSMAGECERLVGNLELACAWYQNALAADPLSTSATQQLRNVAREIGRRDLEVLAAEFERR